MHVRIPSPHLAGAVFEMIANALWPLLYEGRMRWVGIPVTVAFFAFGMYGLLQVL